MEWLIEIDRQLFLWLNSLHAPWLDGPMSLITGRSFWIPLYLLIALWLVYKQGINAVWSIAFLGIAVALSDQLTSAVMKPFFERLRPCHDPAIAHLVHTISGCGGKFGFASSHAANTFALAMGISLLHVSRKWVWIAMFLWAFAVSYSRIYAGVHYPGDLLVGALIGLLIAVVLYRAGRRVGRLQQV